MVDRDDEDDGQFRVGLTKARPDASLPDEVLVVAAILGDIGAFDVLVRRYHAAVVRLAGRLISSALAEDVAQDVWVLVFRALPSIEDPTRFGAWLNTIVRNRSYRVSQQETRRRDHFTPWDHMLLEHLSRVRTPVFDEHADEVNRALDRLPEDYALVLALRYQHEMPLDRISAFIDAPLSTVKWRLHRGKQLMRDVLERMQS